MHPNPNAPAIDKYVVYFEETPKGIVLGRLLAGQIAEAVGSEETDLWPGKRVALFPEAVTVAGEERTAIRARKAPG